MKYITVTPAYGRDYKSGNAAKADWNSGKDFILQDFSSPWDGKPINNESIAGTQTTVNIRFANMAKIAQVKP